MKNTITSLALIVIGCLNAQELTKTTSVDSITKTGTRFY